MRRIVVGISSVVALGVIVVGMVAVLQRGDEHGSGSAAAGGEPPAVAMAALQPRVLGGGPTAPSFDVVKVGPTGNAVIAGRAAPGAQVTVLEGGKPLGVVTADPRGEWVLVPSAPIPPGERQLSLEATDPHGVTARSAESVALSIAAPTAQNAAATLAVAVPQDGTEAARVLQRPDGATAPLSLDAVEYDAGGRLALSGHAGPGATLRIYLGNKPLATATADAGGNWSATASATAAAGGAELRLDQLALDGKVAHRVFVPLTQVAAAELAPSHAYTVRPGNNLWQIARQSYGSGMRYVVIYSANIGKIGNPDRIYPGQVFVLPNS